MTCARCDQPATVASLCQECYEAEWENDHDGSVYLMQCDCGATLDGEGSCVMCDDEDDEDDEEETASDYCEDCGHPIYRPRDGCPVCDDEF